MLTGFFKTRILKKVWSLTANFTYRSWLSVLICSLKNPVRIKLFEGENSYIPFG